jgi:hypothetical protein
MNTAKLVERADELIKAGDAVLKTDHLEGAYHMISTMENKSFRSASLSFIEMVYGTAHSYYKEFNKETDGWRPANAKAGIGILISIKNEIEGGWLTTVRGLVSAEIFSDFLEMSKYLLSNDYKDAAAVIIGSTLEEHLRQLCGNNSIETTGKTGDVDAAKKADLLNSDLAKAGVYNKLDQKNVTAWLDLRNKAAHGQYDQYNKGQVETMLSGVSEFCARTNS